MSSTRTQKLATALIEIKDAGLEDGHLAVLVVEIAEVDEVDQQAMQIAVVAHELVHQGYRIGFVLQRLVRAINCSIAALEPVPRICRMRCKAQFLDRDALLPERSMRRSRRASP